MTELFQWLTWPLNPQAKPSYFDPPVLLTPGGNPLSWEIAVLVLFCLCVVMLLLLSRYHWFGWPNLILVCVAPSFLGLTGTAYMLYRYNTWAGLCPVSEVYLAAVLFPSYIGLVCLIALAIGSLIVVLTRSTSSS